MTLFVIPLILYFFCFYALKKIIPFLKRKSLVDIPSNRGNHDELKPKGGSIVLIPSLIISILLFFFFEDSMDLKWLIFLTSIFILFVVSLLDDIKNLSASTRLSVHFFCVILSVFSMKQDIYFFLNNYNLPILNNLDLIFQFYLISIIIILLWLWIINLFNFMDGMDGLISLQMIFLSLVTNIVSMMNLMGKNFQFLSLIILSISLAFYRHNKPIAKIFLGDSGSIPFGYIAGFILISSLLSLGPFSSILIILLYFFLDSTITLISRFINRKNLIVAHSDHFYQQMLRSGRSHKNVLQKIFFLMILLGFLSILALKAYLISLVLATFLTIILLVYFKKKSKNE